MKPLLLQFNPPPPPYKWMPLELESVDLGEATGYENVSKCTM